MKTLKLYRGIAISENDVENVIQDIKSNGLYHIEKNNYSSYVWKNVRSQITELYKREDLKRVDTLPSTVWIGNKTKKEYKNYKEAPCSEGGGYRKYTEGEISVCFADKYGAEFYATKHNITEEKKIPLLITLSLEIENVAIDGRDFLYDVFSSINRKEIKYSKRKIEVLKRVYGDKIEYYFEKAIQHPNSDILAICDLIICDNDIIIEHSKNKEILGGRFGTIYKSAFLGKIPISPEKINNVDIISKNTLIKGPNIRLNEVLI